MAVNREDAVGRDIEDSGTLLQGALQLEFHFLQLGDVDDDAIPDDGTAFAADDVSRPVAGGTRFSVDPFRFPARSPAQPVPRGEAAMACLIGPVGKASSG